jgi:8-oxo-dGTP pyrophosphatase MutT (NUDIX family)
MKEQIRAALSARRRLAIPEDRGYPAAVALLLYEDGGEYHVVLTARTAHVEHHKNEVSFPGGARDPGDADALATALRETDEEIGVRPADVEVLGALDDMVTITRFRVTPFVGVIPFPYDFRPNHHEVAEILQVPLSHLLDAANSFEEEREREGKSVRMRSFRYGDYVVWGATARMLGQFLALVFPDSHLSDLAVAEAIIAEGEKIE